MEFTKKRLEEMLYILGREAAKHVRPEEIFRIFNGSQSWSGYFSEQDASNGSVGVLSDIIGDRDGCIKEEEFDEIIKPYLAECIADGLGAKKVTIKW